MRRVVWVVVAVLAAVACGGDDGDDDAGPSTTVAPPTSTTADPTAEEPEGEEEPADEPGADEVDADLCALLEAAGVEPPGGPWDATGGAGSCTWADADGVEVTATVTAGIDATLDAVRSSSSGDRAVEDVDAFASGAVVVYDADGALVEAHAPAGADEVVAVLHDGAALGEDDLLVLLGDVALAWENRPLDGASGPTDGDAGAADDDVASVEFRIVSDRGGVDVSFTLTAEEVLDANGLANIVCSGADEDARTGIFDGLYTVTGFDPTRTEGIIEAGVVADDVEGPGTYEGEFSTSDSEGRGVDSVGDLTIDEGMTTGTFVGEDDAGNDLTVTFACRL